METCINCQSPVTSNYCGQCGQPLSKGRLSLKGLYHDFAARFIGLDSQYGRTFKAMWVAPGRVVNAYVLGNRVRYVSPLAYYLITTAILIIIMAVLGISFEDFLLASEQQISSPPPADNPAAQEIQGFMVKFNKGISGMLRFMAFIIAPIFALVLQWFYPKKKFSAVEHMAAYLYLAGHIFYLTMLQVIVLRFTGSIYYYVFVVLFTLYGGYALASIYTNNRRLGSIAKGCLAYLSGMLLYMILFGLIVAAALVVFLVARH